MRALPICLRTRKCERTIFQLSIIFSPNVKPLTAKQQVNEVSELLRQSNIFDSVQKRMEIVKCRRREMEYKILILNTVFFFELLVKLNKRLNRACVQRWRRGQQIIGNNLNNQTFHLIGYCTHVTVVQMKQLQITTHARYCTHSLHATFTNQLCVTFPFFLNPFSNEFSC